MKRVVDFINFSSLVILMGLFYLLIDRDKKSSALVVLADNGQVQNAVLIDTDQGAVNLDAVGETASFKEGEKPSDVRMMSPQEMEQRFGDVLKAEPPKAVTFILYLDEHDNVLDEESRKKIPLIVEMIAQRTPCSVDIIGHTDTVGSSDTNIELSLRRAKRVKMLLEKEGIDVSEFLVKGYGEEKLLIQTADNVKEFKNRNVEIFIK